MFVKYIFITFVFELIIVIVFNRFLIRNHVPIRTSLIIAKKNTEAQLEFANTGDETAKRTLKRQQQSKITKAKVKSSLEK